MSVGWFGYAAPGGGSKTWAEKVVGHTVSLMSTPNPAASTQSELNGVSCLSTKFCVAVGDGGTSSGKEYPIAETYSNGKWAIDKLPSAPATSWLTSVSCSSIEFCLALGESGGDGTAAVPLIEKYTSGAWSLVKLASGTTGQDWASVSCVKGSVCLIVGSVGLKGSIAYQYRVGSLLKLHPPALTGEIGELDATSCTSAVDCLAAGYETSKALVVSAVVERFDTHGWSDLPSPGSFTTDGADCVRSVCFVIGTGKAGGKTGSIAAEYDGKTWSVKLMPGESLWASVSCSSASACVAVGDALNSNTGIIDRFGGSGWSTVAG